MKPNSFFRINKIVLAVMVLLTISSKIFSQNNNDMAQNINYTYATVPTQFIEANGIKFAYRSYGKTGGTPIIYLNHLTANLDNCDPRIMDAIATQHQIISFDYRGVGATTGKQGKSIPDMATDVIAFIHALGYNKVDLLGFSMGGMIAQEILLKEPQLARKVILAGTGPRGGKGVSDVVGLTYWDILKGLITFRDAKFYLFFTQNKIGKEAARQFLNRIKERTENRDVKTKVSALASQLKAIKAWGHDQPADLSTIKHPIFIVNGDVDRMVPTPNSYDMAKRFPNNEIEIYENSGHGGIFQYHEKFVKRALDFFNK